MQWKIGDTTECKNCGHLIKLKLPDAALGPMVEIAQPRWEHQHVRIVGTQKAPVTFYLHSCVMSLVATPKEEATLQ